MIKSILNKLKIVILSIFIFFVFITIFSSVHLPSSNTKDYNPQINKDDRDNIIAVVTTQVIFKSLQDPETVEWKQFTPNLFVLNAYLDLRKDNDYFIRFLTIVKAGTLIRDDLECHYDGLNEHHIAVPYEFNENHAMPFGGYIHSCKLPASLINLRKVNLHHKSSGKFLSLPLKVLKSTERKFYDFTLCIPPLFGIIDPLKLHAFIEMNRILGADHFFLYDIDIINRSSLKKLLTHYRRLGVLTVFQWRIPDPHIWYNGQMSAIHHCLYENVASSRYTIFQDLDELLVPMKAANWSEMMLRIDDGRHCGYRVPMAFMEPFNGVGIQMYMRARRRSAVADSLRSKCIVRPELVFEQGIHHVSKQNVEEMAPGSVGTEEALLMHFRACSEMLGFSCGSGKVGEDRLVQYEASLRRAIGDRIL